VDRKDIRKKRRQEQVREEILQASRGVLLERGISGLTLSAVARELQLTKAALYHYFPSKDALVFELIFQSLKSHAEFVCAAIEKAASGADALEALIRASGEHYGERLDELRLAYLVPQVGSGGVLLPDPAALEKIRPFNELLYGSVATKIQLDQEKGLIDRSINGRRLAFLAHTSILGMQTVQGLVAQANDPLIHSQNEMIEDLVAIFRARLVVP
jgi:AcrR family transcriptional regulator